MFDKLKSFWRYFWETVKTSYQKATNIPQSSVQRYRDIKNINFLSIFVNKLNNLVNIETTFEVVSESENKNIEALKKLCKNLESDRFEITNEFLAEGDMWVFPSHTDTGRLYHRYLTTDKVRVLDMQGEEITDIIGIIDEVTTDNKETYYLNRRHTLIGDNLIISIYATDGQNKRVVIDEWAEDIGDFKFPNVKSIGVGRFKSPISSRGHSLVYGVPLNFGCEEIEKRIFEDLEMIRKEFENAESKIFADPFLLRKGLDRKGNDMYTIPEYIFPIDNRSGMNSTGIDIFSPAIRYSEFQQKLIDDLSLYEQQVGTDRGFLTPLDDGKAVTATEIRRANASTIALIDRIQTAIKKGVESVIKADCIFLGVAEDIFNVKIDFFDNFEDYEQQYRRLANAVDRGIAEKSDEAQWLFPNLTIDEINDKLERIKEQTSIDEDMALEKIYQ